MVMNEAASAPVVSATSRETPTPLERASAYYPLHAATKPAPVMLRSHTDTHSHSHTYIHTSV